MINIFIRNSFVFLIVLTMPVLAHADDEWKVQSKVELKIGSTDSGIMNYCTATLVKVSNGWIVDGSSNATVEKESCTIIIDPDGANCTLTITDPEIGDLTASISTNTTECQNFYICPSHNSHVSYYLFNVLKWL